MTRSPKKALDGTYKVGYRRPPAQTRFRKGVSGNPGGRPRGITAGRAKRLALQEAYRPVKVQDGDEVRTIPTLQAVLRSQARSAAKGNGAAQRHFIDRVQAIEDAAQAARTAAENDPNCNATDAEIARALAAFITRTKHKAIPVVQDRTDDSDLCDRTKATDRRSAEDEAEE